MPTEVNVTRWCDPCFADGERTEGEPFRVDVGSGHAGLLLCESHRAGLLDPLVLLISEYGTKDDGTPVGKTRRPARVAATPVADYYVGRREPNDKACPLCGKTPSTRGSMEQHIRQTHGLSLPEFREQHPGILPDRRPYGRKARSETEVA